MLGGRGDGGKGWEGGWPLVLAIRCAGLFSSGGRTGPIMRLSVCWEGGEGRGRREGAP